MSVEMVLDVGLFTADTTVENLVNALGHIPPHAVVRLGEKGEEWSIIAQWDIDPDIHPSAPAPVSAVERSAQAEAWQAGVDTALNHALRNPDGVTLRLEHLDGRPWKNPYEETIE